MHTFHENISNIPNERKRKRGSLFDRKWFISHECIGETMRVGAHFRGEKGSPNNTNVVNNNISFASGVVLSYTKSFISSTSVIPKGS
jgi:hypothetical protein